MLYSEIEIDQIVTINDNHNLNLIDFVGRKFKVIQKSNKYYGIKIECMEDFSVNMTMSDNIINKFKYTIGQQLSINPGSISYYHLTLDIDPILLNLDKLKNILDKNEK